jgi:hypothetical protein
VPKSVGLLSILIDKGQTNVIETNLSNVTAIAIVGNVLPLFDIELNEEIRGYSTT